MAEAPDEGAILQGDLANVRRDVSEASIRLISSTLVRELLLACWTGDLPVVQSLFPVAIQANKERSSAVELIVFAVARIAIVRNHLPILRFVYNANQDAFKSPNARSHYLVAFAEQHPYPEIWTFLLDNEFPGLEGKHSATLVRICMQSTKEAAESLQVLMDHGFKVNSGLVETAAEKGSPEIVRILVTNCDPSILKHMYILQKAVTSYKMDMVKVLIDDGGFDPNELPRNGDFLEWYETKPGIRHTAMHCAVGDAYLEMIKLLVSRGGRTTVKDGHGKTPIDRARESGQLAAEKLLLELAPPEELEFES